MGRWMARAGQRIARGLRHTGSGAAALAARLEPPLQPVRFARAGISRESGVKVASEALRRVRADPSSRSACPARSGPATCRARSRSLPIAALTFRPSCRPDRRCFDLRRHFRRLRAGAIARQAAQVDVLVFARVVDTHKLPYNRVYLPNRARHDRWHRNLHPSGLRLLHRGQVASDAQEGRLHRIDVANDPRFARRCRIVLAPARPFRRSSSAKPTSAGATNSMHWTGRASSMRRWRANRPLHERRPLPSTPPWCRCVPDCFGAEPGAGNRLIGKPAAQAPIMCSPPQVSNIIQSNRKRCSKMSPRKRKHLAQGLSRARRGIEIHLHIGWLACVPRREGGQPLRS